MSSSARPKVILGGGIFGSDKCPTSSDVKAWCDLFHSYGHTTIDNGRSYPIENPGFAEKACAEAGVTAWAVMDTKTDSMNEKAHSRKRLFESMELRLAALGFAEGKGMVDVMYLHVPCPDLPFEETMKAMNEAYQKGMFKRLGVSNYSPDQVEELVRITKEHGWVQPTVYQGQYNPICRKGENTLFPVLRRHGIAFYVYTPTGARIFSGNVNSDSVHKPDGRWSHSRAIGKFWSASYLRPELLGAACKVHSGAQKHGISGHEVALRWVLHHSVLKKEYGDGIIIGASSLSQLESNLTMCDQGPLPEDLVKVVEDVWPLAEPVAPWAWIDAKPAGLEKDLKEAAGK